MSATRVPERLSQPTPTPPVAPERHRVLVPIRYPVGGIRTYLRYFYPRLQSEGYRFTFVVPDADCFPAFQKTVADFDGVECIRVAESKHRCKMWPEVKRQIHTGRYSLIHSHGFTAAAQTVWANLGRRVPHLTTVHDVVRDELFRGIVGRAKRWVLGQVLRRLDGIVAVGEDVRENLLGKLSPLRKRPERITVIPNGVDVEHFSAPPTPTEFDVRTEFEVPANATLLGFMGRFMEQKGFVILLEALARLHREDGSPPFHLVAVGSHDREREYRKEISRLGLDECISILPFVPDIKPLLHQLDLLVFPSLWEAMPLLPMEALAAGLQVLGTDCLGSREALEGSPSCVVEAGSAEALYRGLHVSIRHPWPEQALDYIPIACERFDSRPKAQALLGLFEAQVRK